MPKGIIVVGMSRKYISIVYRGKEVNKVLAKSRLNINRT